MAVKNTVQAIPLQTLPFGSVVPNAYTLLGALTAPCFTVRIMNATDEDVTVSYDGTTAHDYIQKGDFLQVNAQQNSQPNNYITNFATGFKVYLKGTTGSLGYVALTGYFSPKSLV